MREFRAGLGALLLFLAVPVLLAGGGLWLIGQHQSASGGFSARLEPIPSTGYAILAPDVDTVLRDGTPFAALGPTSLRITASDSAGPLFVGLASRTQAERYLAGVARTQVTRVRIARGPLPVRTVAVSGSARPAGRPGERAFWIDSAVGELSWSPAQRAGQELALVVMRPDGSAPRDVRLSATLGLGALAVTTGGLLMFGALLLLVGLVLLAWPAQSREFAFVVEPGQLSGIAARLGIPAAALAAAIEGVVPPWAAPAAVDRYRPRHGTAGWTDLEAALPPDMT